MRTPTLISLALLFALPLAAGAQIYSWKDASGKVHYSDKPPMKKDAKAREVETGSRGGSEPAAQAKSADVTAPTKAAEGAANGAPPAKSPEQLKAEAEAREKLCDNARMRLIQLESTKGVLVTKDEKGQQVPLVGEARKTETENARKDVEKWCK